MRRTLASLTSLGLLVLGCGDDGTPAETTTTPSTSGEDSTTASPDGETDTGGSSEDSGDTGSTSATSLDTGSDSDGGSSSTGEACGNGTIDPGEDCDGEDLGDQTCADVDPANVGGQLACTDDCSFDTTGCMAPVCGDNLAQGDENCDGTDLAGATCASEGFDSGTLSCELDCMTLDTSECGTCGNVIVDGDEACDDISLFGQTCVSQGFDSGVLACAADCLTFDTTGCGTCGNDLIDGDEVCDNLNNGGATCLTLGFDSGTLGACQSDCLAFDTEACGTCGNDLVDGDEFCDGTDVGPESCVTQGFDSGDLGCAVDCGAYDTATCGTCGNGLVDGAEDCDGMNLGGASCMSLGAAGGTLACDAGCGFDLSNCDVIPQWFDIAAPNNMATTSNYVRSHGYTAATDGLLLDFEWYLGLAAPCDLDFYVWEAPVFGGPYTQLQRVTVNAGPGTQYYSSGIANQPTSAGNYYILGVAWNCSATYYWDNSGAWASHDGGIGPYNVSHWDNSYPGASDAYEPPNTGGGNTAYVMRINYAG